MSNLRRALAGLFLAILVALLLAAPAWRALPRGVESFLGLGRALFGRYLLPFEVLSVLLLAALIGAVFLAKREEE